jgi:hypothetical protein
MSSPDDIEHAPPPYQRLTPDCILDALATLGCIGDGRLLALNSYENRVYQVWLEGEGPVVVEFYRPGRWTDEQILEEHAFADALEAQEVPVIAPGPSMDERCMNTRGSASRSSGDRAAVRRIRRRRCARARRPVRGSPACRRCGPILRAPTDIGHRTLRRRTSALADPQ